MRFRHLAGITFLMIFLAAGAYAQNQYNLPQFANGSTGKYIYRTTFILFNNTDTDATAVLNLSDDNANPLVATIGGFGTNSQFIVSLPAGSTGFLQTDGTGAAVTGAATVTSNLPIGVSAVFTIYDATGKYLTEAGIGASDLLTDFVLPIDSTGFYLTGLALFNPGADASITMTLLNPDGTQAATAPVNLRSFGHMASYVATPDQLFPAISNFKGTLVVHSPSPIAALVLRQYETPTKICYTSLPVVPRASTKLALHLSQVATGSSGGIGFKSSFLIFNISPGPANVTLSLTQNNGLPLTVTFPGSGPGTGTNSTFNFVLNAGASVVLQTDGSGPGIQGAATITSNVPVGASVIFTVLDSQGQFQTEAGVGDSPMLSSMTLPVDTTGSFNTGVALFNSGSGSVTVTLKLLDANGVNLGTAQRTLSGLNHLASFVDEFFPGMTGFKGSLAITAVGNVAASTLRQYASGATYTTLPIAPGTATGTPQVTPLLAQTATGINAAPGDPDIAWSVRLANGSLISGSVSGAGQGLTVVASAGGNNVYVSRVNPLTGNYLMVVPNGTYNLTAYYQPAGVASPNTLAVTYTDPVPVPVSFTGTRDITLPPVTLFSVSGAVTGLGSLFSGAGVSVVFTSADTKIQGQFPLDTGGNYQGVLPAGSYSASVSAAPIQLLPLQSETMQLFNIGSLTVAGGAAVGNYTLPATAMLSGTLSGGGSLLASLPLGMTISATDTSAPTVSQTSCCVPTATSITTLGSLGQYQMALAQNRTFAIGVDLPFVLPGTSLPAEVHFTPGASPFSLAADSALNLVVPSLSPPSVMIYGFVTDSTGNALPNVAVTAYSQALLGAPNVSFSVTGTTDIYGRYGIFILAGSNYRLTFTPPVPKF